jgi:hypothetical protein
MSAANLDRSARRKSWIAQIIVAVILGMAIPGKFTGDPTAISIFEQLGVEPVGRIAAGIFESLAVALLLIPASAVFGGLLALGLMTGAILSHLTVLGIALDGDPSFFLVALAAFAASLLVVTLRRRQIPLLSGLFEATPAATAEPH